MICGTGIDLLLTERFEHHHHDPDFLSQIFTAGEIEELARPGLSRYRPATHFTLKEAALKARGEGLSKSWAWHSLTVRTDGTVQDAVHDPTRVIHAAAAQCRRWSLALVLLEDRTRRTTA